MNIDGWKYYNHAAIPTVAPHEPVNIQPVKNGTIWRMGGGTPLLVRWTTDFDCERKTNWWYVIKDTPFDLMEIKAKQRYEIKKGNKNFDVQLIVPQTLEQEIYNIQKAAFSAYPEKYRPNVTRESVRREITTWKKDKVYGAFYKENAKLCGYAVVRDKTSFLSFEIQKCDPLYEKYAINAALVYSILEDNREELLQQKYLCDGSRSINHETAFQDYLEKYFGFRKAYCTLHLKYRWYVAVVINVLKPFEEVLLKFDNNKWIDQINGIYKMERYRRE